MVRKACGGVGKLRYGSWEGGFVDRSGNKSNEFEVHLTALSYGYATNTRVKFIIVTENITSQSRDADMKMVSNFCIS